MAKCVSDRVVDIVADPVRGHWLVEWIQDYLHRRESKYIVTYKNVNGQEKFFIEQK